MPRVPEYQQSQTRRPVAGTRVGANTGPLRELSQQARRGTETVQAVEQAALKFQQREDTDAVNRAWANFQDRRREFLHGEGGLLNQQGANAKGAASTADRFYQEAPQELIGELANDRQRLAFEQMVQKNRAPTLDAVARHESRQRSAALTESTAATIAGAVDSAAATPFDPNLVGGHRDTLDRAVTALGAQEGWDRDTLDRKLLENRTEFHARIIEAQIDQDPAAARAYYAEHREQIAGTAHDDIERKLEAATQRGREQAETDRILAGGGTPQEQMRAARAIDDPEVRDGVVARLKRRQAEQKALADAEVDAAVNDAWNAVVENNSTDAIPAATWAALPGQEKKRIRDYVSRLDSSRKTDDATYYLLRRMQEQRPDEFRQINLMRYAPDLSQGDLQGFIDDQTKSGGGRDAAVFGRSKWRIMEQGAAAIGLKPDAAEKDNDSGRAVRGFYQRVDNEMALFQQETGRKPNGPEIQEIVDRLSINVLQEGSFLGIFSTEDETPAVLAEIEGIPSDRVPDLAAAVQAAGQPVTEDNIRLLYRSLIERGAM